MIYIILVVLAGLNFAPFVFKDLNIWAAQGFWAHLGIIALFTYSFFEKPKNEVKNIPLALFFTWVAISTSIICYKALHMNRFDTHHFSQYFNLLMVLIFYRSVVGHLDYRLIQHGKTLIKYTILFNLFLCVVQYYGVSQYFQLLFITDKFYKLDNLMVGIMGNGTHLSGFLAMCSPVLFTKNREDILSLCLLILTLFFLGTSTNEPALNGFAILIACSLFYSFFKNRKVFWGIIVFVTVSMAILLLTISPHFKEVLFNDNGRLGLWREYLPIMRKAFISGIGLGSIGLIAPATQIKNAFHMHLEAYHFLIELGIIGLILIANIVKDFFATENDEVTLQYKTIVIGFLVSCFFTYPAHLWLSSMFTVFAYAIVKGNHARIDEETA